MLALYFSPQIHDAGWGHDVLGLAAPGAALLRGQPWSPFGN
jgi:hypothetical protein